VPVLATFTTGNPCDGYPCFTPNTKDVGASSLRATCGPVPGYFDCLDLDQNSCFYNFTMYTCDQTSCLQGNFVKCNSLCLELDVDYKHACTEFCRRACPGGPPDPPSPPPPPPSPPSHPPPPPPSGCANKLYDQCGGQGFKGPTCCPSGSTCKAQSQYYSQCTSTLDSLASLVKKLRR